MRKFGSNKKNPNPPWPNRQPVIVIPPDANASSVGRPEDIVHRVKNMPPETTKNSEVAFEETTPKVQTDAVADTAFDLRDIPIMGFMSRADIERNNMESPAILPRTMGQNCLNYSVSRYICEHSGKLAKIEFMFGEGTHIEKVGIIESVGSDFLSIKEMGTNTHIICSMKNIKFINIYDKNGENNFR